MIRKNTPPTKYANGRSLPLLHRMERTLKSQDDSGKSGLWRSLDEALGFKPKPAAEEDGTGVDRRDFIKLMGAGMGVAGLTACTRQPDEKIVPYVDAPEELIPGRPLFYATGMMLDGVSIPALAESHMGRPTKMEPNTDHPGGGVGSNVFVQGAIRDLYDPDRSTTVVHSGRPGSWKEWDTFFGAKIKELAGKSGAGLAILVEPTSSPTIIDLLEWAEAEMDQARIVYHAPVEFEATLAGAEKAFGEAVLPNYDLTKAKEIVSFDSDFLSSGPGHLAHARDFAAGRDLVDHPEAMNRLIVFESQYSATGAAADHRLGVASSRIPLVLGHVAKQLGLAVGELGELSAGETGYVANAVTVLGDAKGASAVFVGANQPAETQALGMALNAHLGNNGKSVSYIESPVRGWSGLHASRKSLVEAMNKGEVDTLLMFGTNPVYDFPVELDFKAALKNVPNSVHADSMYNETGYASRWHLPMSHFLESWLDGRSHEGTATVAQPLIAPIYNTRSLTDLLAPVSLQEAKTGYDALQTYWKDNGDFTAFDKDWRRVLHDGFVKETAFEALEVTLKAAAHSEFAATAPVLGKDNLEIVFRPDPTVHDGRYANNAWLQETPKPVTTLTWDNAVIMSPTTAQAFGFIPAGDEVLNREHRWPKNPEVVITATGADEQPRTVKGTVLVVPGVADFSVTLTLGYGRERGGTVADGTGFNAGKIRVNDNANLVLNATLIPTGIEGELALTQDHHTMAGREEVVRYGSFDEFSHDPHFAAHYGHHFGDKYSVYKDFDYSKGHQWAKSIDLTRCISCNACVIACTAENNTAVVGKKEVLNGRELHWIRMDRYFGDAFSVDKERAADLAAGKAKSGMFADDVQVHTMPVACVHCEKAPCETVCPVGATTHSNEGINQMVYNRCVGTRYCANNCPYKVRRFNYFQYGDLETESLKAMRNPDVTPRVRGVMEKCTYCIQRINHARIDAKRDVSRRVETAGEDGETRVDFWIKDGEVQTACQQACPTNAIVFGNLNDPEKDVAIKRYRAAGHSYTLLDGYQTEPRTSYLAKIRNSLHDVGPQKRHKPHHAPAAHDAGHGEQGDDHGKKEGQDHADHAHKPADKAHGEAH